MVKSNLSKKGIGAIEGMIALTIFVIVVASVVLPILMDDGFIEETGVNVSSISPISDIPSSFWSVLGITIIASIIWVVFRTVMNNFSDGDEDNDYDGSDYNEDYDDEEDDEDEPIVDKINRRRNFETKEDYDLKEMF